MELNELTLLRLQEAYFFKAEKSLRKPQTEEKLEGGQGREGRGIALSTTCLKMTADASLQAGEDIASH